MQVVRTHSNTKLLRGTNNQPIEHVECREPKVIKIDLCRGSSSSSSNSSSVSDSSSGSSTLFSLQFSTIELVLAKL